MNARVRSRAAAGTAAPADRDMSVEDETYSEPPAKASRDRFTADKLRWIEQMVTDAELKPLARIVGVVLATKHLNRKTGEAWPAIGTLAALVGRGVTQVTDALDALEKAGHLEISRTKGGQKQTNRYRPVLKPLGFPRGKLIANEHVNPSETRDGTPRISDLEPPGNPRGNPYEEPYEEPIDGLPARPMGLRSTLDGSGSAPGGASPTSQRRANYRRGDEVEHPDYGTCVVIHQTKDFLTIRDGFGEERTVGRSLNGAMSDAPF
jgi:hypothetical protein